MKQVEGQSPSKPKNSNNQEFMDRYEEGAGSLAVFRFWFFILFYINKLYEQSTGHSSLFFFVASYQFVLYESRDHLLILLWNKFGFFGS